MASEEKPQGYAPFDLYPYNPSQPPAYAYLALFGIACIINLAAMIPYRCFFPFPLVIGCGMQAAAYYFRSLSHDDVRKTLPFIIQNLLILAAPPLLAASIYMSPRRIARALEAENLTILPRVSSKMFVVVDLACFVTQVAGSIMAGSEEADESQRGRTIILVGLITQVVAFGCFIIYVAVFHGRAKSAATFNPCLAKPYWQRSSYGLYAVSILFLIRNVTRIIEYEQGPDSDILSNEVYLYVLDSTVMLGIALVFFVLHPGRVKIQVRRSDSSEIALL